MKKWSEEKIIKELQIIIEDLSLRHMPSFNQIKRYKENQGQKANGLIHAINRNNRYKYYADILNLPFRPCGTPKGKESPQKGRKKEKEIRIKSDFSAYKDHQRQAYEKIKEEQYLAQCQPSEVVCYQLSQKELKKYKNLTPPKNEYSLQILDFFYRGFAK